MVPPDRFKQLQSELLEGAYKQDQYDLNTINLIAPASPTPLKYFRNMPLRHNAIAEGLLGHRPYAGVEGFNQIERIAVETAKLLFNAEHANVQPHSVSQANQAVYQGLLEDGDRVLGMKFTDGGHLTHGMAQNFSGRFFNFNFYGVNPQTGEIDYEQLSQQAQNFKPKMIVCGASSYPRKIDFSRLGEISRANGAYLMADLSHPAGFIATNNFPQPFPDCDVVTLTLDKTMLGPHGGILLCKDELKAKLDKAVHPGVQSSVPLQRIYSMAQCMLDATKPEFYEYIDRVQTNMRAFETTFSTIPDFMVTGGSDTHLMVIDVFNTLGITGKKAEELLEDVTILTNRQVIPGETQKPYVASGLRFGTSWITARGYSADEAKQISEMMLNRFNKPDDVKIKQDIIEQSAILLRKDRQNDVWHGEK